MRILSFVLGGCACLSLLCSLVGGEMLNVHESPMLYKKWAWESGGMPLDIDATSMPLVVKYSNRFADESGLVCSGSPVSGNRIMVLPKSWSDETEKERITMNDEFRLLALYDFDNRSVLKLPSVVLDQLAAWYGYKGRDVHEFAKQLVIDGGVRVSIRAAHYFCKEKRMVCIDPSGLLFRDDTRWHSSARGVIGLGVFSSSGIRRLTQRVGVAKDNIAGIEVAASDKYYDRDAMTFDVMGCGGSFIIVGVSSDKKKIIITDVCLDFDDKVVSKTRRGLETLCKMINLDKSVYMGSLSWEKLVNACCIDAELIQYRDQWITRCEWMSNEKSSFVKDGKLCKWYALGDMAGIEFSQDGVGGCVENAKVYDEEGKSFNGVYVGHSSVSQSEVKVVDNDISTMKLYRGAQVAVRFFVRSHENNPNEAYVVLYGDDDTVLGINKYNGSGDVQELIIQAFIPEKTQSLKFGFRVVNNKGNYGARFLFSSINVLKNAMQVLQSKSEWKTIPSGALPQNGGVSISSAELANLSGNADRHAALTHTAPPATTTVTSVKPRLDVKISPVTASSAGEGRPVLENKPPLSESEANCLPFATCRMPYKWGSSVEPIIIRTEHPSISVQGKIPSGVLFRLSVAHFKKGDTISMKGNIKEGKIEFGLAFADEQGWVCANTLEVGNFDSTVTVPIEGNFRPLFMCDKNLGIDATITDISLH